MLNKGTSMLLYNILLLINQYSGSIAIYAIAKNHEQNWDFPWLFHQIL